MFRFKQFYVEQSQTAMKVGTDGVMLGAWCDVSAAKTILDIGTGTGLIALMLAQRQPLASIVAVEIDKKAAIQATKNVSNSPFSQKITVLNTKIQEFANTHNGSKFDTIVCNPPYFVDSLKNADLVRSVARHNIELGFEELFASVSKLLNAKGLFSLIIPNIQLQKIVDIAESNNMFVKRNTAVFPTTNSSVKRFLLEFWRNKTEVHPQKLTIEQSRHVYAPDYISLTKDFYVNM